MSQATKAKERLVALLPELDADESVWEEDNTNTTVVEQSDSSDDPWHSSVYECCDTALWRKQLVLTPYMLLDRLKVCADLATEAQDEALSTEATRNRVDRIADEIQRLLALLWRGGLWTDAPQEEKQACDGRQYRVLSAPFTDGKALPSDAPAWLRELLGVPSIAQ